MYDVGDFVGAKERITGVEVVVDSVSIVSSLTVTGSDKKTYVLNNSQCVSVLIIRNGKMIGAENFNLVNKLINDNDLIDFFVQYYFNNKTQLCCFF